MSRGARAGAVVAGLAGLAGPAGLETSASADGGRRLAIVQAAPGRAEPATRAAPISNVIYLERCRGGCTVTRGTATDSRTLTSTVPPGPESTYHLAEFVNAARANGAAADEEWALLVTCLREVYSPYAVEVTDVRPARDAAYHLALIAGSPGELGFPRDVLGVAPLASDCEPIDNAISFTFANAHAGSSPVKRTQNLCWTAAQESAHAFGLDHEFDFTDGRSACSDPMTYRADCGGQKFFRNQTARCGTVAAAACRCSATQNSHQQLLGVFGAGTDLTSPPHAAITFPEVSGGELGFVVGATAGSPRGLERVQLLLNGYPWVQQMGAAFGPNGQPADAMYAFDVPPGVPGGLVDVSVRALEDTGRATDSALLTLTKGPACTSASACLTGQRCDDGRCHWDAPTGALGEPCEFPQFCTSGVCLAASADPGDVAACQQACRVGDSTTCPADHACVAQGPLAGYCEPADGGGCCEASAGSHGGPRLPWLVTLVVSVVLARRRRAKSY